MGNFTVRPAVQALFHKNFQRIIVFGQVIFENWFLAKNNECSIKHEIQEFSGMIFLWFWPEAE